MKRYSILLAICLLFLGCAASYAQDGPPVGANPFAEKDDGRDENRGKILKRVLQLTDDQMLRIQAVNLESRRQMISAQADFQTAKKRLDEAVYADDLDEQVLEARVRAVIEAQTQITKIRTMSEVGVRKVLTPEQLVRFRQLRIRFARQAEMRLQNQKRRDRQLRKDRMPPKPPEDEEFPG